ncbi:uncharacterized protein BX663DRAFT_503266 [Cokeromyces recurvatus]|uniref:uncharacterized protein n=1 Tax=Cokeromyces recurvatus TaxID=90255 RepID=UPI00221F383C|nr:uncharacterized protein BX663DRAFT_503266 [Cokeromyces recurvatus]KAI7904713.1 hypothetical protein BX663DRAFT_503266 [Cokeromyces recurvatus]
MQEIYSNPLPSSYRQQHRYRICLCINVLYGGPFVCFMWLVVNMYACVLSFQKRSPIYSYLNGPALIIQGIVCLLFAIISLIALYSFSLNRSRQLRYSHILVSLVIIIFLIIYFVNLILFGIQKDQFSQWCINQSHDTIQTYLFTHSPHNSTLLPNSPLTFISRGGDNLGLYNCTRLWESELKLSIIVFVILLVTYIHAALCFRYYTYERLHAEQEMRIQMSNLVLMQNGNILMPQNNPPTIMRNIAPTNKVEEEKNAGNVQSEEENDQRSLAQIVRAMLGRL